MTPLNVKVLLVEDSPSDAFLIQEGLLQNSPGTFEVTVAARLDEAIARLKAEQFNVVLLDLALPDCIGIDTLVRTSAAAPQIPIVVLTGADDQAISLEAIRRGGQDYLVKTRADGQIVANAIRYAIQRKKAEEELKSLNETLERRVAERTAVAERRTEQLRQLAAELTLAEQRERQRLASILHDGLQQTLVAAKFSLMLAERGSDVRQSGAGTADLIDEAIEISRSLTAELSPPMLHQGGLFPSLRWLARSLNDRYGLAVALTAPEDMEPVPEEVVILLFQSIREMLFNVVKHAGVKKARVELMQRDSRIHVSIEDEGVGFDPSQLRAEGGTSTGFGLFSISERLSFLGGWMDINSLPGHGSRFNLVIPYSAPAPKSLPDSAKPEASGASTSQPPARQSGVQKKIRVLLADDHTLVRQGLAGLLRAEHDLEIAGEASDGETAVKMARELRPDVVLMDVSMPGMNGIEVVRILHQELPDIRVIGLSISDQDDRAAAMREAGAVNYLAKSEPSGSLIDAIRKSIQCHASEHNSRFAQGTGGEEKGDSRKPAKIPS